MSRSSRSAAVALVLAALPPETAAAEGIDLPAVAEPTVGKPNANSIRSIIRTGLFAGKDTKTIAAEVVEFAPMSAAAAKSTKHIAFYRSQMRKAGELPKFVRS